MSVDNNRNILKKNIVEQTKYYLENTGEFYPFGAIIDKTEILRPIGVYFGKENPDSIEVLNHLEEGIKKGISNGDYLLGAIGMDVLIPVKTDMGSVEKKDALEIIIYDQKGDMDKYYFLYFLDGAYEFIEYTLPL